MLCILYILSVLLKWCHVVIWGGMGYHDLEISEQQWHCQRMTGWLYWGVTSVISAYGLRCHSLYGCCHCAWLLIFVFVMVSSFCSRMLVQVSQHPLVLSRQIECVSCIDHGQLAVERNPRPHPRPLLPNRLCNCSHGALGLDPRQTSIFSGRMTTYPRLFPGHQAIMFSRSSYLTLHFYNIEREENRGHTGLFFHHFPSSCHIPRTQRGLPIFYQH